MKKHKTISDGTVTRRLAEAGLPGRIVRNKKLTKKQKCVRLQWARKYCGWFKADWKRY